MRPSADEVINGLIEAVIELSPPGQARHHAVAEGLDWLRRRRVEEMAKLPGWVTIKSCRNCGQAFFFAERPSQPRVDGKRIWVPMCPFPVISDASVLDGYSVHFKALSGPVLGDPRPGVQWLPHSVLCGRRDRPLDPQLGAIWDRTTGKDIEAEGQVVEGLLKVLGDTE